jgi:hypothetical protein
VLEGLKWDADEMVTRPALSRIDDPAATNELRPPAEAEDAPARDTMVDDGPRTEREQAPSTVTSAQATSAQADWSQDWDDSDPTHPHRRRLSSSIVPVESAAPASMPPLRGAGLVETDSEPPASAIRRTGDRHPVSLPIPLLGDDEDFKATVKRGTAPAVVAITHSDGALHDEIARLKRWLALSLGLALVALLVAAVLASVMLFGGSPVPMRATTSGLVAPAVTVASPAPVVAPKQAIKAAGDASIRMFVDDEARGALPQVVDDLQPGVHMVRFEGGEAFEPSTRRVIVEADDTVDLGTIALERTKVEVLVALMTPTASVVLTPIGGLPEPVSGPWPKSVYLPPGKYTLAAAKRNKTPVMVMLDLSLDKPRREVVLKIR